MMDHSPSCSRLLMPTEARVGLGVYEGGILGRIIRRGGACGADGKSAAESDAQKGLVVMD